MASLLVGGLKKQIFHETEEKPVRSNKFPGLVIEVFSVDSHICFGIDLEPVAVSKFVFPNLERGKYNCSDRKTSNLLIRNHSQIIHFQHLSHRLKSEGAGLKLVYVELEARIEVELSFAESFDDSDPQS